VVEAFAFAEYGLVRVSDIEVYRAAVSFVVPFTDVVEADGFTDRPDEVLADKLFGILFKVLFTDLVFLSEEDGFNVGGDAKIEFVAESLDCESNHVIWVFYGVYLSLACGLRDVGVGLAVRIRCGFSSGIWRLDRKRPYWGSYRDTGLPPNVDDLLVLSSVMNYP